MRGVRLAVLAGVVLLGLDLLVLLVSGSSPLGRVGVGGFLLRGTLLAAGLAFWALRLADPPRRVSVPVAILVVLLLPALLQFQFAGGRLNGDGVNYYVYVRSMLKDGDLDFSNEYAHYGLLDRGDRGDLQMPTRTGLRRSIFSIGPAVVWTPFFLLGEAVARVQAAAGGHPDLSGYGPCHRNAVALGSLAYGFAGVLLIYALLRRHFGAATALGAALLTWWATFLDWYMVEQPAMSHAVSTFAAALVLWLWDSRRGCRSPRGFLGLGLALGLAMAIRWQNGVLLLLPALELVQGLREAGRGFSGAARAGGGLAVGVLIGVSPQLVAWKVLYDEWLLWVPPHGADFLRLNHPYVLETLFSSRHGLLSWTPVLWLGYLGFVPLLRRRPRLAAPLLPVLLAMTYVNMCSGDWWAGGSFSNRRFDSLLPALALGLGASLDGLRAALERRPRLGLLAAALPFVAWNLSLVEQTRRGLIPRDDTVTFPELVGNGAQAFADVLGSPRTWPASWLFAWRYDRPPSQYDRLVGRYLFYRQNNMAGHVDLGFEGDDAMLGEGWGAIDSVDGIGARRLKGRGRLFAPLDVPEDLTVSLHAFCETSGAELELTVNGVAAGRLALGAGWSQSRVRVPRAVWRRELNELVLEAGDRSVLVDAVDFERGAES